MQAALLLAFALLSIAGLAQHASSRSGRKKKSRGRMDEQKRAVHALNRLTFGARPGDLERVTQLGVDKWIELQLHPEKIDDSALDAQARFVSARCAWIRARSSRISRITKLSSRSPKAKARCRPIPPQRAVYEAQVEKYEDKQDRKAEGDKPEAAGETAKNAIPCGDGACPVSADSARSRDPEHRRREEAQATNIKLRELLDLPPTSAIAKFSNCRPESNTSLRSRKIRAKPRTDRGHERRAKRNRARAQ